MGWDGNSYRMELSFNGGLMLMQFMCNYEQPTQHPMLDGASTGVTIGGLRGFFYLILLTVLDGSFPSFFLRS
jgi:hypothetical protein